MPYNAETQLQMQVIEYIRWQYKGILTIVVPQVRYHKKEKWETKEEAQKKNARNGAFWKKMGMTTGTPDITILEPRGDYHGMLLELKTGTNKVSTAQKDFIRKATDLGYYAVSANSFDSAKTMIDQYMALLKYYHLGFEL